MSKQQWKFPWWSKTAILRRTMMKVCPVRWSAPLQKRCRRILHSAWSRETEASGRWSEQRRLAKMDEISEATVSLCALADKSPQRGHYTWNKQDFNSHSCSLGDLKQVRIFQPQSCYYLVWLNNKEQNPLFHPDLCGRKAKSISANKPTSLAQMFSDSRAKCLQYRLKSLFNVSMEHDTI